MSRFKRFERDLTALVHYRPGQILGRLANRVRRRVTTLAPGGLRGRLAALSHRPPAAEIPPLTEALRAFALDPDVSPPGRAVELLEGRFTYLGETRDLGERPDWMFRSDPDTPHLWRMNLHYHRFLVDAVAGALREPRRAADLIDRASFLLDDWSRACEAGAREGWDSAWNSFSVSARLMHAWLARRLLEALPAGERRGLDARLDGAAAAGAEFLAGWLEHDLGGNHLLRNATALVAAGHWFRGPRAESWGQTGSVLLRRELGRQLLGDGFHEERSPMYHAQLLEDVLLCALTAGRPQPWLVRRVASLRDALAAVTHPDGEVALFNDSALGITAPGRILGELADALGVTGDGGSRDLADAGYYRFSGGGDALIFDAGLLGPDHLPAHAHCDALSLEYSASGRRVIVDTGVDRYEPGPERDFQRSTAAHSTLQIGELEQGEPFGGFRMGRRPRVWGRRLDDATAEGAHDGFGSAGVHRRRVHWNGHDGFSWFDSVDRVPEALVTVRVGLAPGFDAAVTDGRVAVEDAVGRFELSTPAEGRISVDRAPYCERFGCSAPRAVLRWTGAVRAGRELRFVLRRLD